MKKKLGLQAAMKFIVGVVVVALILFIPAGTIHFWNAWLFMGLLFVPMCIVGCVLLLKCPDLLQKRLNTKESEEEQKVLLLLSILLFVADFFLVACDFRFEWSHVPIPVITVASVLFLIAYGLYIEVMRENEYLSRTVEVQANQKVIDTGLYGVVRHPMYVAALLLFLMMPLILGSWYAFFLMILLIPVFVLRICNEEKVLTEGLQGYADYKKKVKYRLVPFIW